MGSKPSPKGRSVARVEDRAGRRWTVTVTDIAENEALEPWRNMTGDERVARIGECVLDGLRVKGKLDIPRLRRVHRVLEREPGALPLVDVEVLEEPPRPKRKKS